MKPNGISEQNKEAWDTLYRRTSGSVWGAHPIPFVESIVGNQANGFNGDSLLLDAAAGDGRHLPVLLRTQGKVFACDASPAALEKLARFGKTISLHQCDLAATPFPDESFDFISLIDTIETLPNPEPCLRELRRILKPGGRLLCNIPGEEDDISSQQMSPVGDNGDREAGSFLYRDTYFYHFYDEDEALVLIDRCGFFVLRNEMHHWEEESHPGFREYPHEHTSRVFLLEKTPTQEG